MRRHDLPRRKSIDIYEKWEFQTKVIHTNTYFKYKFNTWLHEMFLFRIETVTCQTQAKFAAAQPKKML